MGQALIRNHKANTFNEGFLYSCRCPGRFMSARKGTEVNLTTTVQKMTGKHRTESENKGAAKENKS